MDWSALFSGAGTTLGWVCFYLGLVVGLLCIPLGLGGTFIILADALILALVTEFRTVGIGSLVAMAALAVLGEVIESFLGVVTAQRFGASRWAMFGTFAGGIAGAVWGAPFVPVVGSLLGAFVGAFAGAFLAEILYRRHLGASLRAGWGAFLGRLLSTVIKFQLGLVMIWIVIFDLRGWRS